MVVKDPYISISYENFLVLDKKCTAFKEVFNDPSKMPVKVFIDLGERQLKELELIREISKVLQKKKEDDLAMAAKAAEDAEEERKREEKKKSEEAKAEETEEKKEE
ncbi:UPF0329 protein ECU05_1680/ECU11_0050-like [Hyposmocoma kahamanoa]|uniref:UPF0329 protein ECU05_1680/ECU11_0050-like n=1 Tax=Hyposmocoma kahamanoa TaxID=1477025 RepID=UPI000E6D6F0B|nr:UPF0329 protein ECU05_1680/ECU11_0050-like [Hyposmocoma kahamanoa]